MLKYASGERKTGACRLLRNPAQHTGSYEGQWTCRDVCRSKVSCCRQQGRWCVLQLFLLLIILLLPPHSAMCFDLSPAKHETRAMQGMICYDKMHNFTLCFALTVVICQQFCYQEKWTFLAFLLSKGTEEAVTKALNNHIICKENIL